MGHPGENVLLFAHPEFAIANEAESSWVLRGWKECNDGRAVDRLLEIQEAVTDQVGVAAEDDELSELNSPLEGPQVVGNRLS